jgi:hypothetical protein
MTYDVSTMWDFKTNDRVRFCSRCTSAKNIVVKKRSLESLRLKAKLALKGYAKLVLCCFLNGIPIVLGGQFFLTVHHCIPSRPCFMSLYSMLVLANKISWKQFQTHIRLPQTSVGLHISRGVQVCAHVIRIFLRWNKRFIPVFCCVRLDI